MSDKVYNKWITEPPRAMLQNVLITLENSNKAILSYVDYDDNYNMTHGYKRETVEAYMNIPTMDIDRKGWHGDLTDEKEPNKDDDYIVCLEIKGYGRTRYKLAKKRWRKNKFYGCKCEGEEIIGWREFPKLFKKKVAS